MRGVGKGAEDVKDSAVAGVTPQTVMNKIKRQKDLKIAETEVIADREIAENPMFICLI